MFERLSREELELMMQENLKRVSELVGSQVQEALQIAATRDNIEFQEFRRNYKVYNATVITPILPRGSVALIDMRPKVGASGIVAQYVSLGDRFVEEWAKQVNP